MGDPFLNRNKRVKARTLRKGDGKGDGKDDGQPYL